jgi:hypothetical protein
MVAVANSSVRLSQARLAARPSAQRATVGPIKPERRSVHQAGVGSSIELNDSIRDPTPYRRAVLLIGSSEFDGACRTFL